MIGKTEKNLELGELIKYILAGDEDQPIILMNNSCGWIGTFPVNYIPSEYNDFMVTDIMADAEDGSSYYEKPVIKIWIEGKL